MKPLPGSGKTRFAIKLGPQLVIILFSAISFICLVSSVSKSAFWVSSEQMAKTQNHKDDIYIYSFSLSPQCTEHWKSTLIKRKKKIEILPTDTFICSDAFVGDFMERAKNAMVPAGFSIAFAIIANFAIIPAIIFTYWKNRRHAVAIAPIAWAVFCFFSFIAIICSSVAAGHAIGFETVFRDLMGDLLLKSKVNSYFSNAVSAIYNYPVINFEVGSSVHCLIASAVFASLAVLVAVCTALTNLVVSIADVVKEREEPEEVPLAMDVDVSRRDRTPPSTYASCPYPASKNPFEESSGGGPVRRSQSSQSQSMQGNVSESVRRDVNDASTRGSVMDEVSEKSEKYGWRA